RGSADRALLLLLAGLVLLCSPAAAQDWFNGGPDTLAGADPAPRPETISDFMHAADLWHDATLKGDPRMIRKRELQLVRFLNEDIAASRRRYESCAARVEAAGGPDSGRVGVFPPSAQRALDDLARAEQWLRVKKRLLRGFEQGGTFAAQYRQIMDYRDILRMEYDQWRVLVADGASADSAETK
ncbi:MAG TPA: hypothetical protein PKY95_09340, partial [candidate division Zixibacteria bacterium]|nr:hypothetical protein [candidate division Zixibacteria bacterium]